MAPGRTVSIVVGQTVTSSRLISASKAGLSFELFAMARWPRTSRWTEAQALPQIQGCLANAAVVGAAQRLIVERDMVEAGRPGQPSGGDAVGKGQEGLN